MHSLSVRPEVVVASESSFDIVSRIDLMEVDNAIQQTLKEIRQRYDFKGSPVEVRRQESTLVLQAENEYKLKACPLKQLSWMTCMGAIQPCDSGSTRPGLNTMVTFQPTHWFI